MLRKLFVLFVIASLNVAIAATTSASASIAPTATALFILRVVLRTPADAALLTSHYDVLEARDGNALFILGDNAIANDLRAHGFAVTIQTKLNSTNQPINQSLPQPSNLQTQTFFQGYRTVAEHEAHLDAVAAAHPDLAKVIDYGDSWLKVNAKPSGHDLKAICITHRRPQDCALSPNTDKPRFFLMAAIHARELTTSEMAWRWMDYLVDNDGRDADVTALLDSTEMWIVPVANPDGRVKVEEGGNAPYLQRKNLNDTLGSCANPPTASNQIGVDLNRNASFLWDSGGTSTDPCSAVYLGTAAASEPEENALEALLRNLFRDQRPDDLSAAAPMTTTGAMLTLHSYSNLVLLPWGWVECNGTTCPGTKHAPNDLGLRTMAFRMGYYNGYTIGQGSEVLYATSGTTDDFAYGALGIAGFTFEIGPDDGSACAFFTPPYSCQDSLFWPLNRSAFIYAAKLARQPYALALGPNTLSITLGSGTVVSGTSITVTVSVNDAALGNDGIGKPIAQTISATELYVDTPPWATSTPITMTASDGAFDSAAETAIAMLNTATLGVGRHTLYVHGQDAAGNWGPVTAQFVTVVGNRPLYLPFVMR